MTDLFQADPNQSSAHFNLVNSLIPDVVGDFATVSGKFLYDPKSLDKSCIEASIDARSITTGDEKMDEKLKGPELFDVKNFPVISFVSTHIEKLDEDVLKVKGNLTVKDVTKEIILNLENPKDGAKLSEFSVVASTIVDRDDFQLELGSILKVAEILVGDKIHITMDITLIKNPQ